MKIALVAPHGVATATEADPYAADRSAHVTELGEALAAIGHDVTFYARKESRTQPGDADLGPRLSVRSLRAGPAMRLPADELTKHIGELARGLAVSWRQDRPDVAYAHYWTNGVAALLAGRDTGIPVVQTFGSLGLSEQMHNVPGQRLEARAKLEAHIARNAAGIVASTTSEAAVLSQIGINRAKVRVVPCGIDTEVFAPTGPVARRNSRPRLMHVGSLADPEELKSLLQALPDMPEAELVLGPAPGANGGAGYTDLRDMARNLGIDDRVRFTGPPSGGQLPALLRSADVVLRATRHEPLGVTTIRAMACGTPVIATAVGANTDAVVDGTTGVLLPPGGTATQLSRSLRDLLATPMRLNALGIAAADRARSRYGWQRVAAEVTAALEYFLAPDGQQAA